MPKKFLAIILITKLFSRLILKITGKFHNIYYEKYKGMNFIENKKSGIFEDQKRISFLYENIVYVIWKKDVVVDYEDAESAIKYTLEQFGRDGKKFPTLVEMSEISALTKEARSYFQKENPKTSSALALVVDSILSRVLGNLFINLDKPLIPVRMFTSMEQGSLWLKTFV